MMTLLDNEVMGVLVGEQEIIKKTVNPSALHFEEKNIENFGCHHRCYDDCSNGCIEDCANDCYGDCYQRCQDGCGGYLSNF